MKKWTWDTETRKKLQGLFGPTGSLKHILVFSVVFDCLEPLKLLVAKFQKQNQVIYMTYGMIDLVVSDLKRYRENIDKEFKAWYNLATTMVQSDDVQLSLLGLAKG